jgi:hypothetical protein
MARASRPGLCALAALLLALCCAVPARAVPLDAAEELSCGTTDVDAAISRAAQRVLADGVARLRSLAGDGPADDELARLLSGKLRMRIDVVNTYRKGRVPCPSVRVRGSVPAEVEAEAAALASATPVATPAATAEAPATGDGSGDGPGGVPLLQRTYQEPQDWELELQKASLAAATDPRDPAAYGRKAEALVHLERPVEAMENVNKAMELGADDPEALYARGLVNAYYGRNDSAVDDFSAVIAKRPEDIRAYVQRGLSQKKLSHFDAAVQDFDRVLLADPENTTALMNRGIAYAGLDRMDMAVDDLSAATRSAPSDPWPYIYRGLAFYQTREYPLMCQDFDKAQYRGKPEGIEWARRKGLCGE